MGLAKFPVIPAEAGIQDFQAVNKRLDPGFHRGDDQKAIFLNLPFDKGRVERFRQETGLHALDNFKSSINEEEMNKGRVGT